MAARIDWSQRAKEGFLASGIDPADRRGYKNHYIDVLQKMALEEALELRGDETVLDFGCGSGRVSYWIAPKVKEVVGLEVTPGMIDLAEKNRNASNVKFMVYDGVHFPVFPFLFDLIFSVGVLQTMMGDDLKRTVSRLAGYLKHGGRFFLIEQVSDNPKVGRPALKEYMEAFQESECRAVRCCPIRNGRWWLLYLIRYGIIPRNWLPSIARYEMIKRKEEEGRITFYKDYFILTEKTS